MKNKLITAIIAAFFIFLLFSAAAFAAPEDVIIVEESSVLEEIQDEQPITSTEQPIEEIRPFTPAGTGTVIDTATNEDGKEFYTITTPDENVFYLIIDRQRGQENVYFLNAVTVTDLLSLAQIPDYPVYPLTEQPPASIDPEPIPTSTPAPEQSNGNMGTIVFIAVVVVLGGWAGWYFKIYRPKQQGAGSCEKYEPYLDEAEADYADDWDDEPDSDDSPPWDEDES